MYKPILKTEYSVYTFKTHHRQEVATFNEAVRIARRLQAYGFEVDLTVDEWHNTHTPQAISSSKSFWFKPDGQVKIYNDTAHFFRNYKIVKSYYHYNH